MERTSRLGGCAPTMKKKSLYWLLRSDRGSIHTEHIVFVALAIAVGHRNVVGYSSHILGNLPSAPNPRRWVVGLASLLASPRGGVSHVKSFVFLPSLAAVFGKR